MTPLAARIAVTGFMHEVNALARTVTRAHGIDASLAPDGLEGSWEAGPLVARLRALRPGADVVELPVWEFGASGPLEGADFQTIVDEVVTALRGAGPLDAVVVLGHGAGRTTDDLDPDATFLRAVRSVIGDTLPLVVVLDFHANVSSAMCDAADVLVAYRTNPHVDIHDRLVEAADHVHRLLDAPGAVIARCQVPMVLPQIAQNTTQGEPLALVVDLGQRRVRPPVRNVSVLGGFSLTDVPDAGLTVCVTADVGGGDAARTVADEVARLAWELRPHYRVRATPLVEAVDIARDSARGDQPVLLADVADNPGGGAPGTSTALLSALLEAGMRDVVTGLHCDAAVVDAAWEAGVGVKVTVELNEGSHDPLAPPLALEGTVTSLVDRPLVPTVGVYAGARRHVGRCCAIQVDGIGVGISSHPVQCADPDTLRHVGLDPAGARVVVVKSRGHFRAGFAGLVDDDRIVEVSAPGVAPVDLDQVPWHHLPRPVFPLDDVPDWTPEVTLHPQRVSA